MNADEFLSEAKRKAKIVGIVVLILSAFIAWFVMVLYKISFVCFIPKYCK